MASRRPPSTPSTPTPNPLTTSNAPAAESPPPAVKAKAPAKPRAPRAKTAAPAKGASVTATIEISEDVRRGMIAQAAYLRAERRGFSGGHDKEREDWIAAEAEVDALLKAVHGSSAQ
jgi:hypothetical protein